MAGAPARVAELGRSLASAQAELQHAVTRSLAAVKPFREHVERERPEREHAAHARRSVGAREWCCGGCLAEYGYGMQ